MTALNATERQSAGRESRRPGWLRGDVPAFVVIALAVLATRAIWFGDAAPDYDEQLYSFIGWRMQFGELPFVDWWDRKPFGLFAIFGLAHWLFGPGPLAYQLVAAGCAFAFAVITYRLALRIADRMAATVAAVLAVLLLAAYANWSGQSEVFFVPLVAGMAALLVDPAHPRFTRRALVAMALGGLALQIKYTVLPQCLFFGCWALWAEYRRSPRMARIVALAAGYAALGLLPTLLVAGFYTAIGGFDAFMFANFLSFFDRVPAPDGRWRSDIAIGFIPVALMVLLGVYAALRLAMPQPRGIWLFYCGWLVACIASVFLPGTVYLYYVAALAAPTVLVALPVLDGRSAMRGIPGLLLVAAMIWLVNLPGQYEKSQMQRQSMATLAADIAPHVGTDDNCLWLWDGPTALYRLTNACVPTHFVYPDHLNNALETPALGIDQTAEVARVLATRPGAIVTADHPVTYQNPDATALVEAALERDYTRGATVELHGRMITAWLRRD